MMPNPYPTLKVPSFKFLTQKQATCINIETYMQTESTEIPYDNPNVKLRKESSRFCVTLSRYVTKKMKFKIPKSFKCHLIEQSKTFSTVYKV